MCTAFGIELKERFFGRNLDLDRHFGEAVVLTPRGYCLPLRHEGAMKIQYALLGMARVEGAFPLYAEAFNECGIAMAGLNFIGNAAFSQGTDPQKASITTFELIPWVRGQAKTVNEAVALLKRLHLTATAFSEQMPAAELHWFLTDGKASFVLESRQSGIRVYPNPLHVLTNNPPFMYQLARAAVFCSKKDRSKVEDILQKEGIAIGSFGSVKQAIPGDYSSTSRFVRAAELVGAAKTLGESGGDVATCFQILSAVAPIYGCVQNTDQAEHYTLYSVVANLGRGELFWRCANSPDVFTASLSHQPANEKELTVLGEIR
jgi:choloylglycine hydrolase